MSARTLFVVWLIIVVGSIVVVDVIMQHGSHHEGWSVRDANGHITSSLTKPDFDASQFVCVERPRTMGDTTSVQPDESCTNMATGTVIDRWPVP